MHKWCINQAHELSLKDFIWLIEQRAFNQDHKSEILKSQSEEGYKNANHYDVIKVTCITVDIMEDLWKRYHKLQWVSLSTQAPKTFIIIQRCSVV